MEPGVPYSQIARLMTKQPIRLLIVEDLPADAELMILQLRQDGFEPDWRRVEDEAGFLQALELPVDLILADYTLPHFSGTRALAMLGELGVDIPLILVSGTVGEEMAVEAIKNGAYDYVIKERLTRLPAAVRNALNEKYLRKETAKAESALQERVEHSQSLLRLSRALEHSQTYGEILRAARAEIMVVLGYQNVWVYLLSEDKQSFRALTGAGDTAEPALEELPVLTIQGDRMLQEIAAGKGIVVVEDARTDERTNKEIVNALGNRTIVNVPIFMFERHLGAVGMGTFGDEGPRLPTDSEQEYLTTLASHLAVTLDRIHLLTRHQQVEEDLRKTEEKYRTLIEQLPAITYLDVIETTVQQGMFNTVYLSPQIETLLGYTPDNFYSEAELWTRLIHPDDRQQVLADHARHYETHNPYHGEYRMFRRDGSEIWVRDESVVVKGEGGTLLSQGVVFDITEQKQADEALKESETNLAAAQSMAHLGSWELDLLSLEDMNSNLLRWSDEVFRIFGYQPGGIEVTDANFLLAVHPDDRAKIQAAVRATLTTGQPYNLDHRIIRPDGVERIVHEQSEIIRDANGRPIKMVGTVQDVTNSRRAEEALRQSEERYRLLFNSNPQPMWVYDLETLAFLAVNESAVDHYGYEHAEFLSMTIKDIRPPSEFEKLGANLVASRHRAEKSGTWKHRKKDGTLIDVDIVSHEIVFDGHPARLVLVKDVTERKQAEEALAYERYLMRSLMDNIPDAVYFKDRESRFIRANKATAAKHGLSDPDLLVGKTDFDFFEQDNAQRMYDEEQTIIRTGEPLVAQEGQETWPDRPPTWDSASKVPLRNEAGEIIGTLGVSRDITEKKQHEVELEALATVSAALRKASTRAEMLPIMLDQLFHLLKVEAASLAMRDPNSGETVIELARGAWAGGTGRRIPAGEGISGRVIATGAAYINNDINTDPRYLPPLADKKLSAAACVPLKAQELTIGALWIARQSPITPIEVQLLTAISNIAASAIQRATLFEQTQKRLQQISALHSIDIAISSSFDLRFTLNILLEQVSSHLGVDATDVLLLNPHTQMLEYVAGRGFLTGSLERLRIRLGEGSAGQAALQRRIVSIPDLQDYSGVLDRKEFLTAERFVSYYGVPLIAKGQIKGVLEIFHRSPLNPDPDWLDFLETLAEQAAIAINDATMFDNLQRSNTELILAYDATIEGWSRALDLRDNETEGHTQRVTTTTLKLARLMNIAESELIHMRRGALLHDIGKMGIPDSILLKPGELTSDEWVIMRMHPIYAYDLIRPIEFLRPAVDIPYYHHEKWDGSGYPRGLKGDHIPLAARIFMLADVWDALLSDRPYRKAWSKERARDHIISETGKHFDPEIVKVFLDMDEIK
jgi:PAS domain S-box-containing protein